MESNHDPSNDGKNESIQSSERLRACRSVYEQFPVDKTRTRVLVLHSHSSNAAEISCSLEAMTLDSQPSRAYTALSYVWGDASVTEDILVNGVPFPVTVNLASALRQIRKSFGEVLLWIDAISINQSNIPERNQQVLLMKDIYSKAVRVIGWLGPDENGGSQALNSLETLLKNVTCYPSNFEWVQRMPELFKVNGTYTINSDKKINSNDRLEKLMLLLRRPFWGRIWTVQEIVLPLNLRLLCGEEFMDLPEPVSFYNTITRLARTPNGRPSWFPLHICMRLVDCIVSLRLPATLRVQHLHREHQVNRAWEGISGFINARVLLERHQASDSRDHVYGLLGLLDLDIVPDYGESKTVADVYLELGRHGLKATPIDILSLAGTRSNSNAPGLTQLETPSWVPDWRLPVPATTRVHRYPQSHAFPSNGGLRMKIVDQRWLRGSAVVWDVVSETESKAGWDLVELDLLLKLKANNAYPSGISRLEAFVMLWVGGYDGLKASMRDLRIDSDLFRSYSIVFFTIILRTFKDKYPRIELPEQIRSLPAVGGDALKLIPNEHRESYMGRSRQLRYNMRCFHTKKGYIGLGPLSTEVGDIVCVLEGHKAPVLLRKRGSHYIFVGDCDVVGIMNGEVLEAVKRGEAEITEIEIR